jgi:hypothetical protein
MPDALKEGQSKLNLIHRGLSEALQGLSLEYALKVDKKGTRTRPVKIWVDVQEQHLDLRVRLTVEEVYYKEEDG